MSEYPPFQYGKSRFNQSQPKHPGIGPPRSPPSSAAQSSLHWSLTIPPAGGRPTGGMPCVSRSGLAQPGPASSNPATALCLTRHLEPVCHGRPYQGHLSLRQHSL
ncbi:hypothetical protein GOODEAATRI_032559 [Goodea atripinnis]|uniref:Uncharacterized protein n=1 Tax=Goodea atripinnis TaxID=208336 RepID=A0ABV0NPY4_9TELE